MKDYYLSIYINLKDINLVGMPSKEISEICKSRFFEVWAELEQKHLFDNITVHSKFEYIGGACVSGEEEPIVKLRTYLEETGKGHVIDNDAATFYGA